MLRILLLFLGADSVAGSGATTTIRIAAVGIALTPLLLLVTASRLAPNPDGLGTHQQLGLPPCSVRVMLGIRCPSCGMTTSWAYFVRGQWPASIEANLGGFLLAWCGLATMVLGGRCAVAGSLPGPNAQRWLAIVAVAVMLVTLIDWGRRLTGM